MDPVTVSTTLATLVGLICNYRQEKGSREGLDHQKFMEWLEYHRHDELKNLITNTYHLQTEVDSLLREDSQRLAVKLNGIEEILARLLSRIEGFEPVVRALHPGIQISEQAFGILTLFAEPEAGSLIILRGNDGRKFCILPISSSGSGATYQAGEPRFFDDDIRTLHSLGLIIQEHNSSGEPYYRLAREGYNYVQRIKEAKGNDAPMP